MTPEEQEYVTKAAIECKKAVLDFHCQMALTHDARILFATYLHVLSGVIADLRDGEVYTMQEMTDQVAYMLVCAMNEPVKVPRIIHMPGSAGGPETKQ